MTFLNTMSEVASEYGIFLSELQISQLDIYYHQLIEWNQKVNLTALTEPEDVAVKHMIDSLSCYEASFFPQGCSLIDVGTGAGFPGIPLKILRPDIKLTLLDSLNKRVTFLQQLVSVLELTDVACIHARAEDGGRDRKLRAAFDIATSRAVARLNVLAELCMPFVKAGGCFIALKGAQYDEECVEAKPAIAKLGGRIDLVRKVSLPRLPDIRGILYIKKTTVTPDMYPRRVGQPEKNPLT